MPFTIPDHWSFPKLLWDLYSSPIHWFLPWIFLLFFNQSASLVIVDSERDTGTPENKTSLDFQLHLCRVIFPGLNRHPDDLCQTTWLSKSNPTFSPSLALPSPMKHADLGRGATPPPQKDLKVYKGEGSPGLELCWDPRWQAAQHPPTCSLSPQTLFLQDTLWMDSRAQKLLSDGRAPHNCHQSCLCCLGFLRVKSWRSHL